MDSPPDGPDDDSPTRPEVQSVREVLSKVGFLAHLQVEELEILLARMQKLPVVKGTVIINQDDLGADRFFIVVRGRCTVWVRQGQPGPRQLLRRAGPHHRRSPLGHGQGRGIQPALRAVQGRL